MMAVEVTTPEDNMGDVIGDINSRRGQIQAMEERGGARVVRGPSFRCPRCSATWVTCGPRPRVARATRCSFRLATPRCRPTSPKEIIAKNDRRVSYRADGVTLPGHYRGTTETVNTPSRHQRRSGRQAPTSPGLHRSGEGQVRADEAARQHRHHRSHRPWQDDADGSYLASVLHDKYPALNPSTRGVRSDRQGA